MIQNLRRNLTPGNARDLLRHGLTTAIFACIIALALTVSGRGPWRQQFVYSLSIALISWIAIDIGRLMMSSDPQKLWPHGWRGGTLVVVGCLAGFVGGTAIGDAFSGYQTLSLYRKAPQELASILIISLIACVVICFFYYSRGKSKFLQGEIALAQRDATDARLKLLETQLEPHMLFNTLANLRVLITSDPQRAVAMLDRLNSYLRVTLSGSRALAHPLSAEFARLGDYLELMSVRMGPRLAYTLDLPSDLRDVPVPPLLLQPLVENSIRHGLEPKVEGGRITVSARREDGRLVIEVLDSGVGLGEAVQAPADGGFGLTQVRERLSTVFGARSTMALSPAAGGGTRATLSFPVRA